MAVLRDCGSNTYYIIYYRNISTLKETDSKKHIPPSFPGGFLLPTAQGKTSGDDDDDDLHGPSRT